MTTTIQFHPAPDTSRLSGAWTHDDPPTDQARALHDWTRDSLDGVGALLDRTDRTADDTLRLQEQLRRLNGAWSEIQPPRGSRPLSGDVDQCVRNAGFHLRQLDTAANELIGKGQPITQSTVTTTGYQWLPTGKETLTTVHTGLFGWSREIVRTPEVALKTVPEQVPAAPFIHEQLTGVMKYASQFYGYTCP